MLNYAVAAQRKAIGVGMSNAPDVKRTLDHCMLSIKGAAEAMADDMHSAAMRLGAAEMMLASASSAVHKRAAQLTSAQVRPDPGPDPGAEGR
jgi:hypothetical protein